MQPKLFRLRTHHLLLFASGTGSNVRNIIEFFRHDPAVHIAGIVSNKPDAGVLLIAEKENIPVLLIHLVDELYDHGKTIFQASVDLLPEDSPEAIAHKIHQLEYNHFPQVIRDYLQTLPA